MKRVLIIGGCGYIGSQLFHHLRGQEGLIVDTMDLEWFGNFNNGNNIKADFAHAYPQFFDKYNVVILLAAHSSVKMCENNLNSAFQNNTWNFLRLIQKLSHQQFIYASSSSIYGGVNQNLFFEDCTEYKANNYYDMTKYEIDNYAQLYASQTGLEYYGLRFGTVNGPSVNFRDEIMINAMFTSAKKNKEVRVSNPHIRRPILGLNDLCRAIHKIIKDGRGQETAGIYNLASFNSNVELIGSKVADLLKVPLIVTGNSGNPYDFAIGTTKFEVMFNFQFKETINSIVNDLELGEISKSLHYGNRNKAIEYGKA